MCGLVGSASTEGMKSRSERLQFMRIGLDIDSWRGWESTGLALIPELSKYEPSKGAPIIYKRALNGRDFIQLNKVEKYLSDIEKYPVVIGHNRAATTGRGNIIDHNAHPFQYGKITLVHNGHIRNTHEFKGAMTEANCQVDSAQVAWAMNEFGEQAVLEQVDGGFVFVWWNSETGTLNIARNKERPLHMAFANKENTFYWTSELTALLHLLKDVEIDPEVGILYPQPWHWYKFNLKDLREFEKTPFVQRQGRRQNQTILGHHGTTQGYTEQEIAEWERANTTLTHSAQPTVITSATSKEDAREIEDIRREVSSKRLKDIKLSGVPTSRKRIARAKVELKRLGIDYNAMRNCTPGSWTKYKNQSNLGSVLAKTKKEGYTIEILQVRHEDYLIYHKFNNLLVDCVNVRATEQGGTRVVGIVSPKMQDYLARKQAEAEEDLKSSKEGSGSIERNCDGPDGTKVSTARFCELVANGCGHCGGDIEPKQHGAIVWLGRDQTPICPGCSFDQGIMKSISTPSRHRNSHIH